MGRIKTQLVKRLSAKILIENPEKFTKDFSENKKTLNTLADIPSKKIRNLIAGSITSRIKQEN